MLPRGESWQIQLELLYIWVAAQGGGTDARICVARLDRAGIWHSGAPHEVRSIRVIEDARSPELNPVGTSLRDVLRGFDCNYRVGYAFGVYEHGSATAFVIGRPRGHCGGTASTSVLV
jgi:hypothetical protein